MKARVKGTSDIIEVEFDKDALNACYPPYYDKEHDMNYQPEQLEWVDNVEAQKKHRRINEIDKDIQKIEEVLTNGNARILELEEEKRQLEVELKLIEK